MPTGLVEVRKKSQASAKKPIAKSDKAKGGEKEVDIGPFVVLGVAAAAVLYHVIPH